MKKKISDEEYLLRLKQIQIENIKRIKREYSKKYGKRKRAENPEKVREYYRQYYKEHAEKINAQHKKYYIKRKLKQQESCTSPKDQ